MNKSQAEKLGVILVAFVFAVSLGGCSAESHQAAAPVASTEPATAASDNTSSPAAASNPSAAAGPTIEKPPTFPKGYKLTFSSRTSVFDVTYNGVQEGLLVFHYDTKEKLPYDYLYTPDLKLAGISTAQEQSRFDPPVGYVDFPLYVGKKWNVSYKATSNSRHSMGETSVEVVSYGPVKVPYGTVDAFRIKVRSTDREIGRANPFETYWYSPEIGYFVKHETNRPIYEDPFELTAYTK